MACGPRTHLDADYGWLSIVAFDWLPSAPGLIRGLPGKWWADSERAYVKADGELTLGVNQDAMTCVSTSRPQFLATASPSPITAGEKKVR